jgi:hypothetical protein
MAAARRRDGGWMLRRGAPASATGKFQCEDVSHLESERLVTLHGFAIQKDALQSSWFTTLPTDGREADALRQQGCGQTFRIGHLDDHPLPATAPPAPCAAGALK